MGHRYAEIAFTPGVRAAQETNGSRAGLTRVPGGEDTNHRLGPAEAAFIAARDSFYMASVSETGWPYVQHRGGPSGFVRVLGESTIGFADFRGNRQYVSLGNLTHDDRVSIIFVDYAARRRLKLFGRARVVDPGEEPGSTAGLLLPDYRARVERGFLIDVTAFDWNCPQHIPRRFTQEEVEAVLAPLRSRIEDLEGRLAAVRDSP